MTECEQSRRDIAIGIVLSLAASVAAVLSALGLVIVLGRTLGAEG